MKSEVVFSHARYQEVRDSLQNGDIVFVHGDKNGFHPVRQIIMWATGSQFVHCGVAFTITVAEQNRVMMTESQGGTRRRIVNLSFYSDEILTVVRTDADWNVVGPKALVRFGKERYSWISALYVGIRDLLSRKFNVHLRSRDFKNEICSEYVGRLFDLADVNVSPQGLFDSLVGKRK